MMNDIAAIGVEFIGAEILDTACEVRLGVFRRGLRLVAADDFRTRWRMTWDESCPVSV